MAKGASFERETCKNEHCTNKRKYTNGFCRKHALQIKRHGKTFKTRFDPNDFVNKEDCIFIVLRDKYGNIIENAVVSKKDRWVKKYKWYLSKDGYAVTHTNGTVRKLHKIIYPNDLIDHKDRNKMNNKRGNLRKCTFSQNQWNRSKSKNNNSGVTGVSIHNNKRTGFQAWRARIKIYDKEYTLGYYAVFEDAVKARRKAEQKYYKEFAPIHKRKRRRKNERKTKRKFI